MTEIADMVGEKIASSFHTPRHIYIHKDNPEWVIKVDENDVCKNIREWEFWNNAPPHIKRWLVPCISISRDGKYLVMVRGTQPVDVPKEFCEERKVDGVQADDLHAPVNWVNVNGRVLLADYEHLGIESRIWPKM